MKSPEKCLRKTRALNLAFGLIAAVTLCGVSFGAVQPSDYDQQIVEFLLDRHPGVASIDHSRLDRLLGVIAKGDTNVS